MVDQRSSLGVNEEKVAAKVMDGEAIIINLSSGVYYSMDNVGGVVWEMIEAGYSLRKMVRAISERYDSTIRQVQGDLTSLVGELLREGLIIVAEAEAPEEEIQAESVQDKLPYALPRLNIYRDMEDYLALDPPSPELPDTPWKATISSASHKLKS